MQSEQQTNAPPPSANRARAEVWTVRIPNPLVQVHPEAHRHDTALEHTSVRWNAHGTPDRPAGWYVHTTGAEPAPGEPGYGIGPTETGTTGPFEIDWLASFLYTLDGRALAHCREGQGHERMIRAEQLVLEGLLQRLGAASRRYSELDTGPRAAIRMASASVPRVPSGQAQPRLRQCSTRSPSCAPPPPHSTAGRRRSTGPRRYPPGPTSAAPTALPEAGGSRHRVNPHRVCSNPRRTGSSPRRGADRELRGTKPCTTPSTTVYAYP